MEKNTIGERLKQERTRLGLTQEAFAAVGGVKKLAQISYEQGKTLPDAGYLAALANIGLDILFVTVGIPSVVPLTADEGELLGAYRMLDVRGKARVLGVIEGASDASPSLPTPKSKSKVSFYGSVGQKIKGDITAPQTINVGLKKK